MGRLRKYTTEAMLAALKETRGMVYLAASRLGCDLSTIYDRIRSTPAVARVVRHERGVLVDTAELKLYSAVVKGEPWAVQMALKAPGKDRGYVERTEHKEVTDAEIDRELAVPGRNGQAAPAGPFAPGPPRGPPGL